MEDDHDAGLDSGADLDSNGYHDPWLVLAVGWPRQQPRWIGTGLDAILTGHLPAECRPGTRLQVNKQRDFTTNPLPMNSDHRGWGVVTNRVERVTSDCEK